MEMTDFNNSSIVTPHLIKSYLTEAKQAYVSAKVAAARSAAYIYLTWAAALSPWAKAADREALTDNIAYYDKNIDAFNSALDTLKKNADMMMAHKLSPTELDTRPKLSGAHLALYNKLMADVIDGRTFEVNDHRKVKAQTNRENTSPFVALVKYALELDRPEDSSTASRYASVLSFLHERCATTRLYDVDELIKQISDVGGFERAVLAQRGIKPATGDLATDRTGRTKALAAQVKEALKSAPSRGVIEWKSTRVVDGYVILVGRCDGPRIDVIGELPVSDLDAALAAYEDEALLPVAPMTEFVGRVIALGQLVEEGRQTGITVNGTTAGERVKEQRSLSLILTNEGNAELMVSALYADASVVVRARPKHEAVRLGDITASLSMKRQDFLALQADVLTAIDRRLIAIRPTDGSGALSWELIGQTNTESASKTLSWEDLTCKFRTPLTVEGFRPKFTITVNRAQIIEVLEKRYDLTKKLSVKKDADGAFDVEFLAGAFSPRTLGKATAPSGTADDPVSIRCRERDAHALLITLKDQKSDTFTFAGDPRGLLAVHWEDELGSYSVFVPSRLADGGLNPSRLAPLDADANHEVAATQ